MKSFKHAIVAIAAVAAAGAASAQSWSLQAGSGRDYNRTTLSYNFAPRTLGNIGSQTFYLAPEAGLSYWHTQASNRAFDNSVYQLSFMPMVRTYFGNSRVYAEGGVGVSLFSDTHFAGRELSTAFQFGSSLGIGFQQTERLSYGLRISHFSNAGIKKPNPGLDVVQATVSYKF